MSTKMVVYLQIFAQVYLEILMHALTIAEYFIYIHMH